MHMKNYTIDLYKNFKIRNTRILSKSQSNPLIIIKIHAFMQCKQYG